MIINLSFEADDDAAKRALLLTVDEILETDEGKRNLLETCEEYLKTHPSIPRGSAAEDTINQVLIGTRNSSEGLTDNFIHRWRCIHDLLGYALARGIAEGTEP